MAIVDPEEHHIELSVTEARQGRRGMHALIILIVSTALTVIAFVAAYAVNHRDLASVNSAPIGNPAAASQTNTVVRPAAQTPPHP